MANLSVCLFLLIAVSSSALAYPGPTAVTTPSLTLNYEDGTFDTLIGDQPTINGKPVASICATGVWAIYNGKYYTYDEYGLPGGWIQILYTLEERCVDDGITEVGSARIIGSHSNNSAPSITIFNELSLQGSQLSFEDNVPNFRTEIHSIVTINTQLELFPEAYYQGESVCVQEVNMDDCVDGVCWLFWYNDDLPWDITFAKSGKLGCSESAKKITHKVRPSKGPNPSISRKP